MTKLEFLDKINDILVGLNTLDSDLLGSLYDELLRSQWIPVEERLPEFVYPIGAEVKNTSDYVLVYNGYTMYISRLVGGEIHWWEDNSELAPTHWMPLPVPPQQNKKDEQGWIPAPSGSPA